MSKKLFLFSVGIIIIGTLGIIYINDNEKENNDNIHNRNPKSGTVISLFNYFNSKAVKPKEEEVKEVFENLLKNTSKVNNIKYRLENLKIEDCKKSKYKDVFECLISVRILTKNNINDRRDNLYLRKDNNEWKIIGMDK